MSLLLVYITLVCEWNWNCVGRKLASKNIGAQTNIVLDGLLRSEGHDIRIRERAVYRSRLQSYKLLGDWWSKSVGPKRRHHLPCRPIQLERFTCEETASSALHLLSIRDVADGSQFALLLQSRRQCFQLDNDPPTRFRHLHRWTLWSNSSEKVVSVDPATATEFGTWRTASSARQTDESFQ